MCGIAAIWNAGPGVDAAARVGAMLAAMRHRGPDGRGGGAFAGGAMGMVRLALVDLSERGQQPLWSADGRVAILFNGEMYNFRAERARLAGYPFQSATDSEVVLALYLRDGEGFVERLRGMYALAIFDWRGRDPAGPPRLVLARDPFGIKPLYLSQPAGERGPLVVASEVRGLLASGLVPARVSADGLADYLNHGFVRQPGTLLAGVRMLAAGHVECHEPGRGPRRTRFWRLPAYQPRAESLDQSAARLRGVLEESIRLHALADAPVGAFLSGGIDSAAVVGLMRRQVADLRTYTLCFPDLPGEDESAEAAELARRWDCRHTLAEITSAEVARALPRFAGELDQPSADGLNTWLVSRAAAREVKGVLSGLGGDELFAGYPVVRRMVRQRQSRLGRLQSLAGRAAHRLAALLPAGRVRERAWNLAARRSVLALWEQSHTVFRRADACRLAGLSGAGDAEEYLGRVLSEESAAPAAEPVLGQGFLLDSVVYLGSQLLRDSDAASMAHSLELRVPFVDVELVRFSRSCDDRFKLHANGQGDGRYAASGSKRVLIHALRDVLPADILARPKRGFTLPYARWLQTDLAPLLAETCSREVVHRRGLLDPEGVSHLYERRAERNGEALYPQLWSILILELWCRAVLDG